SLFLRGDYDINADWRYFLDTRVSRVESFGRFAPVPSSPWPGGLPLLEAGSPNHPATSPANGGLNTFWADYQDVSTEDLYLAHRFVGLGPRDTFTDMNDYVLDMGVETSLFGIDWSAGVRSVESKYFELGRNYVVAEIAQQFIDDGSYNIYDPYGVDESVASSIAATTNREAMFYEKSVYLDGRMQWLALPGGDASLAFGGEYREVDYTDTYDSLSEGGQIVGSAGNSAGGGRNVKSFFGEAMLPVLDDLDLNVALRYDDYSDAGDTLGARVAARYALMDSLSVRGSFSQAGHAPTLDTITQSPAFSSVSVVIPWIGIGPPAPNPVVVDSYSISNPDLESEESDILSIGVVFEPFAWLSGSLDYVSTEIDGRITAISAQQIVNCLAGASTRCPEDISFLDASGPQPQPRNGVGAAYADNSNPFSILFIQTGFVNSGSLEQEGLDLRLDARFDLGVGVIRHELMLSQLLSYTVDGGADVAGSYGLPERRINLRNSYDFANFSASWNLNYIGPQDETRFGGNAGVDSWLTHDIQVAYALPWDGRVALGVINMTDEDPPLDAGEGRGYNFSLFNGYGRLPYLRYTQSF
ncbi:MAG: TonB-dependent receptor, partial [Gammaproteobacteria bacterium]|nr:TonB-dependent receptor [Gammaproteobacteria bacterium]